MNAAAPNKPGRPKSEEKRMAILYAAADLFLNRGFSQTSVEEVARHSGVSKQTVYSHFSNKDALFTAVIEAKCEQYKFFADHEPEKHQTLEQVLTEMARQCVALFHDEEVIAMYSTVIAEGRNTPHVADLFYQAGPQASIRSLSRLIAALSREETSQNTSNASPISEKNANMLALDFYNMMKSEFHVRSLMGLPYSLSKQRQSELIDAVVQKTLVLYHHFYK